MVRVTASSLWSQACGACAAAAIRSAARDDTPGSMEDAASASPGDSRLFWKHWRQRTGRPCVGLKGTVVSTPHSEHVVRVSVRTRGDGVAPVPVRAERPARLDLQGLHRLGSFLNCLSKKKSCSPAVKMNSLPQSAQVSNRSRNSIAASPGMRDRAIIQRNPYRLSRTIILSRWLSSAWAATRAEVLIQHCCCCHVDSGSPSLASFSGGGFPGNSELIPGGRLLSRSFLG